MESTLPAYSAGPFASSRLTGNGRSTAAKSSRVSEPFDSVSVQPRKKQRQDRQEEGLHLVSIFEDKPRQTIGVAALNLRSVDVTIHEFVDTSSFMYTLSVLQQYDPVRVILPRLAVGSNTMFNRLTDTYSGDEVVSCKGSQRSE